MPRLVSAMRRSFTQFGVDLAAVDPTVLGRGASVGPLGIETAVESRVCGASAFVIWEQQISGERPEGDNPLPAGGGWAGIGSGFRRVTGRDLRSERSTWVRHGAPLLLVLYLAWIVSPALHQYLEYQAGVCQSCPTEELGGRILSHSPDAPCSDPDHHHRPRPAHDEDHCLTCQLGTAAVAVLPFAWTPLRVVQVTRSVPSRSVSVPLSPALLTISPRAPPPPPSA